MALARANLCGSSNPASVYDERGIFSATYHFEIRPYDFMYSYNWGTNLVIKMRICSPIPYPMKKMLRCGCARSAADVA